MFGGVGALNFEGKEDIFFDGAPGEELVFLKHISEADAGIFDFPLGRFQKSGGEG